MTRTSWFVFVHFMFNRDVDVWFRLYFPNTKPVFCFPPHLWQNRMILLSLKHRRGFQASLDFSGHPDRRGGHSINQLPDSRLEEKRMSIGEQRRARHTQLYFPSVLSLALKGTERPLIAHRQMDGGTLGQLGISIIDGRGIFVFLEIQIFKSLIS